MRREKERVAMLKLKKRIHVEGKRIGWIYVNWQPQELSLAFVLSL